MKIKAFFLSKIVVFIIQILILSIFIVTFKYTINLSLDVGISALQDKIIQILANYVLFNNRNSLLFIYSIWIATSLVPIFMFNNVKKASSMNLTTYFFPNFFVYTFLYYHSRNYFEIHFGFHLLHSILLGLIIILISISLSILLKKVRKIKPQAYLEDLENIARSIKSKCTKCGTEFDSSPLYCYNCNAKLIYDQEENARLK